MSLNKSCLALTSLYCTCSSCGLMKNFAPKMCLMFVNVLGAQSNQKIPIF